MIHKSVLCMLALLVLSCQHENPSSPSALFNYFPLAVGNEWVYSTVNDTSYRDTTKIFDQVMVGKQTYYTYGSQPEHSLLLRRDSQGRICLRVNDKDRIYFDFTVGDGEAYRFKGFAGDEDFGYVVTVRKHLAVKTLAGQFENCVDLSFDSPYAVDDEFGYVFAPDVGIVEKHGAWIGGILFAYVLN
ncbi:MAG: hypothetical protein ACE5HO_17345 [bacterium]